MYSIRNSRDVNMHQVIFISINAMICLPNKSSFQIKSSFLCLQNNIKIITFYLFTVFIIFYCVKLITTFQQECFTMQSIANQYFPFRTQAYILNGFIYIYIYYTANSIVTLKFMEHTCGIFHGSCLYVHKVIITNTNET